MTTPFVTAADGPLYDELRRVANARVDKRPRVIARCESADDVAAALAHARSQGLRVAPRGRGHGYTGDAIVEGGLVLDLRALRTIEADGATGRLVAGPAARLGDVLVHVYRAGLGFPAGSCTDVGVGGYTLGGGYGDLGRSLGLACDLAVSFDVVTASGDRFTVDRDHHPDLFWALRGGGGGHFVTVLSFTFQLAPSPPSLPTMTAFFELKDLERVLSTFLPYFEHDAPDALHVLFGFRTLNGLGPVIALLGVYNGTDLGAAQAQFDRLTAGATPIVSDNRTEAYFNFKRRFDNNLRLAEPWMAKGRCLRRGCDPHALAEVLTRHIRTLPNRDAQGYFAPMGGQIARGDRLTSAFATRDESMLAFVMSQWKTAPEEAANVRWIRDFIADLGPFLTSRVYVNEVDEDVHDWQHAYFGDNYERLRAVKRTYDPDGLFLSSAHNLR